MDDVTKVFLSIIITFIVSFGIVFSILKKEGKKDDSTKRRLSYSAIISFGVALIAWGVSQFYFVKA